MTIFRGGETPYRCPGCGTLKDNPGLCGGCRNLHRADTAPWWETMVTEFFAAVHDFMRRRWIEILVIGGIFLATFLLSRKAV